jgi:hypothetical protein
MLVEGVSYCAVLQQITRHRSFAFSVQSSRAASLPLDFVPIWRGAGQGRMFSQEKPNALQRAGAGLLWALGRTNARMVSWGLKTLGIHRQHWQLPIKPYATVSMYLTSSPQGWGHFFSLRRAEADGAQSDIVLLANELEDAYVNTAMMPTRSYHLYGPHLPEPLDVRDYILAGWLNLPDGPECQALMKAVVRVARVSTRGKESTSKNPERLFKRLIEQHHASPFEHFWMPPSGGIRPRGYLPDAITLRTLLNMDAW